MGITNVLSKSRRETSATNQTQIMLKTKKSGFYHFYVQFNDFSLFQYCFNGLRGVAGKRNAHVICSGHYFNYFGYSVNIRSGGFAING